MTDPAYNVNAAIQAENVAERLYYPDRLARLREIEENDIEPGRFEERAPIPWAGDPNVCRWANCTLPFTGVLYGSPLCDRHQEIHRSPEQDRMVEQLRKEKEARANA